MFIDYASQYPEAIPLRMVIGPQVAEQLIKWMSWVGEWIHREIVIDQGINFMSHVLRSVCQALKIKHLKTLVYHPLTNRLVECFNGTLRGMLRWCAQEDSRRWDLVIPPPVVFRRHFKLLWVMHHLKWYLVIPMEFNICFVRDRRRI